MKRCLIIFIRKPVSGKVKTRLAKSIGDQQALEIYRRLLAHTRAVCEQVNAGRFLFYADEIDYRDDWCESRFSKHLQDGADLGDRMRNAFELAFNAGCEQVLIIGSDCPGIHPALIESAFRRLTTSDVVIGPAEDGGYYLLGMSRLYPSLFENKSWSTDVVLTETVHSVEALSLDSFLLPVLRDIDTVTDLPAMAHLL